MFMVLDIFYVSFVAFFANVPCLCFSQDFFPLILPIVTRQLIEL